MRCSMFTSKIEKADSGWNPTPQNSLLQHLLEIHLFEAHINWLQLVLTKPGKREIFVLLIKDKFHEQRWM